MNEATDPDTLPSQWCLVGNIVTSRPYGPGGIQHRPGTRHFSGGTKVWYFPAQWGDGYEQIPVIGRHRGSKQFVTMIVSFDWITHWRAQVVYHPEVLRRLEEGGNILPGRQFQNWASECEVKDYLAMIRRRLGAEP